MLYAFPLGFFGSLLAGLCFASPSISQSSPSQSAPAVATSADIEAFIKGKKAEVLTFAGFSGAGYQDEGAMLAQAASILDAYEPAKTIINIGATAEGIGAVYELAKRRGFTTIGIVSELARDENVLLSPCVDQVFFIKDNTWGGRLPDSGQLAPTSAAIVANSAAIIAIGGGEIARDEMLAAREAGKPVRFIPADMNHQLARDKAQKKGQPEPTDFRGAAHLFFAEAG